MKTKVQKYISRHSLLNPFDKIMVAVSGGADSVALLHLLLSMRYDCVVAHCNFHLRGEESDRDEQFVAGLANKYGCKLLTTGFDTKAYACEQKISIEMAARELRYRWFEEIRQAEQAACVAVAHHRDDAAETILMNLARGAGIHGLTGIKPRNGRVVRPLLCVSRREIMAFVRRNKLRFVTDSTNADTQFTRNFVRHEIVPAFGKINPSFSESLLQTAEHLNDVAMIYNEYVADMKRQLTHKDGHMRIDIARLKREKAIGSLLFEILKDYDFNSAQSADVLKSLGGISGKQFFSPTHRLVKDREALIVSPLAGTGLQAAPSLHVETFARMPGFTIDKSPAVAYFDGDKVAQPFTLRHWQAGDAFYPFGMKGRKKLSDFFTDRKYTLQQKEQAWLLISGNDIAWIVGERIDDRFKVTDETRGIVVVKT